MLFSELPYLCRCFFAAVSSPCCFPARKSFPLLHVRISPSLPSRSPTFGRCAVSPHFLLTFRRCAEAALPRAPSVAAFPHPSYHSHLPKVSRFPTFSTHLPKVRRSTAAPRAVCRRISPPIVPFPPSEGEPFPHIFYSPSEGEPFPHIFYSPSEGAQKK